MMYLFFLYLYPKILSERVRGSLQSSFMAASKFYLVGSYLKEVIFRFCEMCLKTKKITRKDKKAISLKSTIVIT